MTLLIDGDVFLFTVTAACQRDLVWGQDDVSRHLHLDEAQSVFSAAVEMFIDEFNAEEIIVALSGDRDKNWRKSVMACYKSHRGGMKPVGYKQLEDWVIESYRTEKRDNLEADDLLGIYQTTFSPDSSVLISSDKDMFTLPGRFARLSANSLTQYTLHEVTEEEARLNHLKQTLIGDKTDGYPGCPGIGEVTAEKVLKDGTWDEVVAAYDKTGLSEEVALDNARVARILHKGEYNHATGKVDLWTPNNGD